MTYQDQAAVAGKGPGHIEKVRHVILEVVISATAHPSAVSVTAGVHCQDAILVREGLCHRVPGSGLVQEPVVEQDDPPGGPSTVDHVEIQTAAVHDMFLHGTIHHEG